LGARTNFSTFKRSRENIPKYAGSPELSPITTGLGEIYQYDVYAKKGYEDKYTMQLIYEPYKIGLLHLNYKVLKVLPK
jgi:Cu/Ag efflux pump CusA